MSGILRLSNAGGVTSETRYASMLAGYGDFGAMQRIAYTGLSTSAATVVFPNIPQTYQDLFLVIYGRSDYSGTFTGGLTVYFDNQSATTGYSVTRLLGDGSSASSARLTTSSPTYGFTPGVNCFPSSGNTSGIFGVTELHILNYANTTTAKTGLMRNASDNNGAGNTILSSCLWNNTAPITRMDINTNGNWVAGSSFALYGIRAGNS